MYQNILPNTTHNESLWLVFKYRGSFKEFKKVKEIKEVKEFNEFREQNH